MLGFVKQLLGLAPKINYSELVKNGAIIVDVRSKNEFSSGNIPGSLNIPLDQIGTNLGKLSDKNKTIITCCASGMRSAAAKNVLKSKGYTNVHNGGGWYSLLNKITK